MYPIPLFYAFVRSNQSHHCRHSSVEIYLTRHSPAAVCSAGDITALQHSLLIIVNELVLYPGWRQITDGLQNIAVNCVIVQELKMRRSGPRRAVGHYLIYRPQTNIYKVV